METHPPDPLPLVKGRGNLEKRSFAPLKHLARGEITTKMGHLRGA
jgi:hypothetical protein